MDKYRILGVDSGASTAELRAAYLALMKSIHPDISPGRAAMAREINEAYWTLRDADRRNLYDQERLAEQRPTVPAAHAGAGGRRNLVLRPTPARRKGARATPIQLLALAIGIAAIVIVLIGLRTFADRPAFVAASGAHPSTSRSLADSFAADVRNAADQRLMLDAMGDFLDVRAAGGLPDAQQYSEGCFNEFRRAPARSLLTYCAAFDAAAAVWQEAAPPDRRLDYFRSGPRHARFGVAAAQIPSRSVPDQLDIEMGAATFAQGQLNPSVSRMAARPD